MSFAASRADALDYAPCQYGTSKLMFRGPKKSTDGPYIAVLGGSEVYGRFIERPFTDLVEEACGLPVLNLGHQNAGIDAFLYDPDVMSLAKGARLTVLHVMAAQNMSNRFYRVHPRRNDRFLGPSSVLKSLYHEVDFTDFSFNKHMLSTLRMVGANRFNLLRDELQQAWAARMRLMLQTIDGPVLLLWLREEMPKGLGAEPLFVGADMVADLSSATLGVVEVVANRAGRNLAGMVHDPMDAAVASEMLGVETHQQIAKALSAAIAEHI
ncbi:DUF6473 family protein [Aestuariivita boseongensis]|uniref:DUF6473 family protein n=1 Tax=Aestuariivita boseongensis TaxID=1470562 RepID=UPI0006813D41|nr:DUF6473 family protein [Aestuariivita boseongensis]